MRIYTLFFVLMFLPTAVLAEASGHIAYCDGASSTAALQKCVNKHHADAQEKLNIVYETVSATLEDEDLQVLRNIQSMWISYRDAECAWESSRIENSSLVKLYELSCMTLMTEDRIDLLQSTYANEDSSKLSDLSGFPRWMNAMSEDHPDVLWRFGERQRTDLNCDGTEDIIMVGAAVSRMQKLENDSEDGQGRTPHGLDVVVGIAENTSTGRPKSQLFRLPITQSMNGPGLCSEKVTLRSYMAEQPAPLESTEAGAEPEAAPEMCLQRVAIQAKNCDSVTLSWSGKDFVLDADEQAQTQH